MKRNKLICIIFIISIILTIALTGCTKSGVVTTNGNKQVTKQMDDIISDYIIKKNATSYPDTEKQFEVHRVYGTSESKGIIDVYMWSYYAGFNRSTGTETQAGHSLAALIRLDKRGDTYSVVGYQEPEDGTGYQSSLEEMFPKKYVKKAIQDVGEINDLQEAMEKKVSIWLEG